MTLIAFLFVLAVGFAIPVATARAVAGPQSRRFVVTSIVVASPLLFALTFLMHQIIPLQIPRGDDYFYLRAIELSAGGLGETLLRIAQHFDQTGFPLLVVFLSPLANGSLLALKSFNLCLFLLTGLTWFRIGQVAMGEQTGRRFLIAVLLSAPLWVYFFFLLKDMTLVLCQSLVILGALQIGYRRGGLAVVVVALIGMLLMRIQLVALNLPIVLAAALLVRARTAPSRGLTTQGLLMILGLGAVSAASVWIITNPEMLAQLGLASSRSLSMENVNATLRTITAGQNISPIIRVISYFVIEMSWFSGFGTILDTEVFRGYTAIPWVFFGLPFFFAAFLLRRGPSTPERQRAVTLVLILLGVTTAYFALSFITIDTTRWRMPGFPAMAALAALGWNQTAGRRAVFLSGWVLALVVGLILYYGFG